MTLALANNNRTQIRATIKRASARARLQMNTLDKDILSQLESIYVAAANDLDKQLQFYADGANNLRIEVLEDIRQQINNIVNGISKQRETLLNSGLQQAINTGVMSYQSIVDANGITRVADDTLRFMRSFVEKDGLQLSDRIWRLNNNAKQALTNTIETGIVQGWGASEAANRFLNDGQPVPTDIQNKINSGSASTLAKQSRSALLTGSGSPRYNAMRVFRTEINRAHGEAYIAAGEQLEDLAGWKYLLSDKHPETDICDMHSRVNRYGLGPGVYPDRKRTPWPAHPNTLSYVEIVFTDEITAEDKAGKLNRIDWLKDQPAGVQRSILGASQKRAALQKNILRENQIATPWRVLKKRYERSGINTNELKIKPPKPQQISGTFVTGINPAELKQYIDDAWKDAPDIVKKVIKNAPPVKSITVKPSGGSYFYPGGAITLDRKDMTISSVVPSVHDVYRHEYGHFIDFHKGAPLSTTPNKKGGISDTIKNTKKTLTSTKKTEINRRKTLADEVDDFSDLSLQDLFGSLTLNRIGRGHKISYLRKPGHSETEVFANLFNIYARKDRVAWRYIEKELPDLATDFIKVLETL